VAAPPAVLGSVTYCTRTAAHLVSDPFGPPTGTRPTAGCTSFWTWSGARKPAEPRHQLSDRTPTLRYFVFIHRSA
jgi:hypothetical protein